MLWNYYSHDEWIQVMPAIGSTLQIDQAQNNNYCLTVHGGTYMTFLPVLLCLWI